MDSVQIFSDSEAAMGIRYAKFSSGLMIDRTFLLQAADGVLKKLKEHPELKMTRVRNEFLCCIRHIEERQAYAAAIGKMFAERSASHRKAAKLRQKTISA